MLATLERPTGLPASPSFTRTGTLAASPPPVAGVRLVPPPPMRALLPVPTLSPVLAAARVVSVLPDAGQRPLRMTMRARRLLAGVGLLCCTAVGVVAVDVLATIVPFASSTSYADQEASYLGSEAGSGSGALVPATGSTITVDAGDTLWSLAERVDPDADPREIIAAIMTLNGMDSPTLQPGQVLRLP